MVLILNRTVICISELSSLFCFASVIFVPETLCLVKPKIKINKTKQNKTKKQTIVDIIVSRSNRVYFEKKKQCLNLTLNKASLFELWHNIVQEEWEKGTLAIFFPVK